MARAPEDGADVWVRVDTSALGHLGLQLLDPRGQGYITLGVWEQFMRHLMPRATKLEMRVRFAMLDLDGNGKIDRRELQGLLASICVQGVETAPEKEDIISKAAGGVVDVGKDKDGNGPEQVTTLGAFLVGKSSNGSTPPELLASTSFLVYSSGNGND